MKNYTLVYLAVNTLSFMALLSIAFAHFSSGMLIFIFYSFFSNILFGNNFQLTKSCKYNDSTKITQINGPYLYLPVINILTHLLSPSLTVHAHTYTHTHSFFPEGFEDELYTI